MAMTVDGNQGDQAGESRRRIKARLTKARLEVVERENKELREQVKTLRARIEALERERS